MALSATIPDPSVGRWVLSGSVNIHDDLVFGVPIEIVVCNGANVGFRNLTLGDNSRLRIESGSLAIAEGCMLTLGRDSRLDARGGTLDLTGARCNLKPGGTLMLADYPVKGGTLAGGWGTEYDGPLDSVDYRRFQHLRSYLDAPICKVFEGTEFKGRWDMDRAYPQWFADAACDDWSVPINKAIALKTTGDVFLPAGIYFVKHTIVVPMGIRLIGENGTQEMKRDEPALTPVCSTVLMPRPTEVLPMPPVVSPVARPSIESGFSHGVVVAVNVVDSFTGVCDKSLDAVPQIDDIKYCWKRKFPCPGTAVENIMILNKWDYSEEAKASEAIKNYCTGMPFLRGIFVAGGARIENVLFNGLWQSLLWQKNYCDSKTVVRCTLHRPGDNNFEIGPDCLPLKLNEDGSPKIEVEYAIDMGTLGDAMIFRGNAIHDPEYTKGVCFRQCHGGIIDANIINCFLDVYSSNGLSITGNHFEGSSAGIYIEDSSVTVDSNYFEKWEEASIHVRRIFPNVAMVRLSNNIFQWSARYTKPDELEYDAALVEAMSRKCGYDVIMSDNVDFMVSNCFRTYANAGSTPRALPFGILAATEVLSGENYEIKENALFNEVSPWASCQSNIVPVNKIGVSGCSGHKINTVNMSTFLLDIDMGHGKWVGKSGIYSYKYRIAWSDRRRIYSNNGNNGSLRSLSFKVNETTTTTTLIRTGFADPGTTGTILFNIGGDKEYTGLNLTVHLYRSYQSPGGGAVTWEKCIIPLAGSCAMYDNGICVSGFAWKSCEEPVEVPFNDGITGIECHGNNVDVYSTKPIDFTVGEWTVGDRVYNVGTDDSWMMKIKK
ncbi:hypothetical protein [uncultured Muribaculum sp.]|uniref:hypothetical protein n=1 Tax=uncultured Muribaculum sp. TaxID=1918613 RepID=UPI0025E3F62A|nr:hypothetical protein [uncultured Muribaculum sp.]